MSLIRRKLHKSTPHIFDEGHELKQWLRKHGKSNRIIFPDDLLQKLKKYFISLDDDNNNAISPGELEDPLILFGICKNRAEVRELFDMMDIDGSGQLEFKQFLNVFRKVATERRQSKFCKRQVSTKTMENFTNTLLGIQGKIQKGVSFRLGLSIYRRKHLMKAMMGTNPLQKKVGKQVMSKFQEQVSSNPLTKSKLKTTRQVASSCLPHLSSNVSFRQTGHRRIKTVL